MCPLPLELRAIDLLERNDYVPHTLQGEPMEVNEDSLQDIGLLEGLKLCRSTGS